MVEAPFFHLQTPPHPAEAITITVEEWNRLGFLAFPSSRHAVNPAIAFGFGSNTWVALALPNWGRKCDERDRTAKSETLPRRSFAFVRPLGLCVRVGGKGLRLRRPVKQRTGGTGLGFNFNRWVSFSVDGLSAV
jgi:hypothetical protein